MSGGSSKGLTDLSMFHYLLSASLLLSWALVRKNPTYFICWGDLLQMMANLHYLAFSRYI